MSDKDIRQAPHERILRFISPAQRSTERHVTFQNPVAQNMEDFFEIGWEMVLFSMHAMAGA